MVREFGQNDSALTFKGFISKTCRNIELDATRMYNTGRIKKGHSCNREKEEATPG